MSKKKVVIMAITATVICALLVAAYLTRDKGDSPDEPEEYVHIAAQDDSAVAGPALDALPEDMWEDDAGADDFTTRAQLGEVADSIGVLTIDKIGLSCHVYDSDENTVMEDMKRGAAHYKSTSYWNGNVGLSAHNGNASYSFFDKLHQLKEGDIITYETTLGVRQYAVKTIVTIGDEDWSYLDRTPDNYITLTTCVTGQETQRLCVQAAEIPA